MTILVSKNQIARLDEGNLKTEPAVEKTISESEPQLENTDVGPSHQDEASAATSSADHKRPKPSEPARAPSRINNNPTDSENLYPQTCLKKEGGCDGYKENSRNLEVFFIKVSKNKSRTYMMTFFAFSIRNGHTTKLNSNCVWRYQYLIDLSIICQK